MPTSTPRWSVETDDVEADCAQPARETASASGTGLATTALCLVTAIGWAPWMVAVVGTGRHHGAGTLVGVEPTRRGSALEVSVELVPSTVAPRAKPRMTPSNAATEERRLHSVSSETTSYGETPGIPIEVTALATKAIAARLFEEFLDVLH